MIDMNDFIGIPYKQLGRSMSGADCYGLVILIMKALGVVMPDGPFLRRWPEVPRDEIVAHIKRGGAVMTDQNDFVVVTGMSGGLPVHIGVVWRDSVIHSMKKSGSVIDTMRVFSRQFDSVEFYRCQ